MGKQLDLFDLPVPELGLVARGLVRRPRARSPREHRQIAISFASRPDVLRGGERIGKQVVVSVSGEMALVRCDCGAERTTLWRKLLQRGSTSCVRCAARSRSRPRSIPNTRWYEDDVCRGVLRAHPGGASLEEVAEAYGVARESVRQIEAVALLKIGRGLGADPERLAALLFRVRRRTAILEVLDTVEVIDGEWEDDEGRHP